MHDGLGVTTLELAKQVSMIVRNMPSLKGVVRIFG